MGAHVYKGDRYFCDVANRCYKRWCLERSFKSGRIIPPTSEGNCFFCRRIVIRPVQEGTIAVTASEFCISGLILSRAAAASRSSWGNFLSDHEPTALCPAPGSAARRRLRLPNACFAGFLRTWASASARLPAPVRR